MRNIISGVVGIVFGGLILLFCLMGNKVGESGAYGTGGTVGAIFGGVMLVAGVGYLIYALMNRERSRDRPSRRIRIKRKAPKSPKTDRPNL